MTEMGSAGHARITDLMMDVFRRLGDHPLTGRDRRDLTLARFLAGFGLGRRSGG